MSILLTSVGVAAGLGLGRWLAQRAARREAPRQLAADEGVVDADVPREVVQVVEDADEILWSRFPCRLGDVIVHPSGDEAWLAGAIVLSEDVAAAVLFVAPEAKNDRAVYVRAKPNQEIFWLSPIGADDWNRSNAGTDPPTTIEVAGEPFERLRRLPYRTEQLGQGTPSFGKEIVVAEYKSMRSLEKRVIAISGSSASVGANARAWIGTAIDLGVCDVLPAGKRAVPEKVG